jgi:toxin ParE1/3/4
VIKREVRLSEEAERDLESLYDYIATHDSITAAEYVWAALEKTWTSLETLAERGNFPKEIAEAGDRIYRELRWKPYRIIYRVDPNVVTVYAVVDGRRNIKTFLRERLPASTQD